MVYLKYTRQYEARVVWIVTVKCISVVAKYYHLCFMWVLTASHALTSYRVLSKILMEKLTSLRHGGGGSLGP